MLSQIDVQYSKIVTIPSTYIPVWIRKFVHVEKGNALLLTWHLMHDLAYLWTMNLPLNVNKTGYSHLY